MGGFSDRNGAKRAVWISAALLLAVLFVGLTFRTCTRSRSLPLADELDRAIRDRALYCAERERLIESLRFVARSADLSEEQACEVNDRLYDAYRKYTIDSAIRYVRRNLAIAERRGEVPRADLARLRLASLYAYSGKNIEALRMLEAVRPDRLSQQLLTLYYDAYYHYYGLYATQSGQQEYLLPRSRYADSLLRTADPSSFIYRSNEGYRLAAGGRLDEAEALWLDLLAREPLHSMHYAEITHALGRLYGLRGDPERQTAYYMRSAIADIRNATKENTSIQLLAMLAYEAGDLPRAVRYTQVAIEDALFCNVQFRTTQIAKFHAIVNAAYLEEQERAKSQLQRSLILVGVLSCVLVLLFGYAWRQMRQLARTKRALSEACERLKRFNDELNGRNERLSDANTLKEQYIVRFFDMCSLYIDKMENYRKALRRIVQNRQIDELNKLLKSTTMLEKELDELHGTFDRIFLNLYPAFIDDFNALLVEAERIERRPDELLNKELRIFALLRLGITDSAKIASFLRCSLSTVYNYRTRMRNRAVVPRDEFERMVMRIGEKT